MRELHLFAGAGGGILGGRLLGHRIVCAVEIDHYCQQVLLQRQRDGVLPWFPIWDDIRTFNGRPWRGLVDVVCGGFPCQDISVAGKGKGIKGERSGLWSEMARVICEVQPPFIFVENSPMLRTRGLYKVLGDLAKMGYDARWGVLGADDTGAPHQRKRMWVVAHADGFDRRDIPGEPRPMGADGSRLQTVGRQSAAEPGQPGQGRQTVSSTAYPHTDMFGRLYGQAPVSPAEAGVDAQCDAGPAGGAGAEMADAIGEGLPGSEQPGVSGDGQEGSSRSTAERGRLWWAVDPADLCDADHDGQPASEEHEGAGTRDGGAPEQVEARQPQGPGRERQELADALRPGFQEEGAEQQAEGTSGEGGMGAAEGAAQPDMGGVADGLACWLDFASAAFGGPVPRLAEGIPRRTDRIKALGNGQVPACATKAWEILARW